MADDPDPIDRIAFLARSKPRTHVLRQLLNSGPATQRSLRDRIDASRSTIARALTAFEERDWVRRDSGTYQITPVGELVIRDFIDLKETVQLTDELSGFLQWFPLSEYAVEPERLRSAEIVSHTPGHPYAPARAQTELLQTTEEFRGLFSSLDLEGTKLVHEQVVNGTLEAEVIVSSDVDRTIETEAFAPLFAEQLETGRLTVRVADDDPPFYLGIGDEETVQIGVEDDEGFPRALLESTDDSLLEWANEVYREYREAATIKRPEDI